MTSAFIIDVNSKLQQDPNDETAALLRVLIYKIDNTTFGDNVPALPQWTGPPQMIVHVQAILFASLTVSLFSAFLAMLGKQWLNRYASTDMRGTAIERSQNRQRKLDGVIAWYFDHVMESLPLMLQIALLLLGCALSRYLWEIDTTIASVVIAMTSFGILFYIFIVVTGTASESSPYQTPGARICRHIIRHTIHNTIHHIVHLVNSFSAKAHDLIRYTMCYYVVSELWLTPMKSWYSIIFFVLSLLTAPVFLLADIFVAGLRVAWFLVGWPVACYRTVYHRITNTRRRQTRSLDQETIKLDLRCISWILHTSLDKAVHLSTLKHLATMTALADFGPTLVIDCLNAFIGCVRVGANGRDVVIVEESGKLATASALCFLNTVSHLLVMDSSSKALEDVRQRYLKVISIRANFYGHQFYHLMNAVCRTFFRRLECRFFEWNNYKPSAHEHTIVAHTLLKVAWYQYYRLHYGEKVPRWILRFALHSLSLDPPPPASVVADCLLIIAIDLGCGLPNAVTMISDEGCVCIRQMSITLTLD